jgi:two-component system response regulator YesN
LSEHAEEICRWMAERKPERAMAVAARLPVLMSRQLGSAPESLAGAALFLSTAVESMCLAARNLGCEASAVGALFERATADLNRASSVFQLHEAWLHAARDLLDEVGRLYSGKRAKMVERACRVIQRNLEQGGMPVTISDTAAVLGISASHFSRIFKRETGRTFEQYVSEKRVAMAERLLLDPLNNVSQVAQRCGFSDPSYFARVFRKATGRSPTEFTNDPLRNASLSLAERDDRTR